MKPTNKINSAVLFDEIFDAALSIPDNEYSEETFISNVLDIINYAEKSFDISLDNLTCEAVVNTRFGRLGYNLHDEYRNTFALYADDEFLQTAATPDALADNVFTHTSQFYPWDDSDFDTSDSLSDWETSK